MKSMICAASALGLLAIALAISQPVGASSDDTIPTIEKVMETLHKGKNSPLLTVKAALKKGTPDWSKVKEATKLFATYGPALPQNAPPRGDKKSYEKLAKAYAAGALALDKAAGNEDLKGARAAFKKITSTCNACHEAHKPEE